MERLGEEWFRVSTGDEKIVGQTFDARRLLLATGLRDLTPDCPGFREFYGGSVFHCPDCDGFEVTGQRVAVLGNGRRTVGFTLNLLTWTDRLTPRSRLAVVAAAEGAMAAVHIHKSLVPESRRV